MNKKSIIPYINAENELESSVLALAQKYSNEGADALYIFNYTGDEQSREEFLHIVRHVDKEIDIPFYIGCYVQRFEDVKKALYTGASWMVIRKAQMPETAVLEESIERFGRDKVWVEVDMSVETEAAAYFSQLKGQGAAGVICKHVNMTPSYAQLLAQTDIPLLIRDSLCRNDLAGLLEADQVEGVMTNYFENKEIYKAKLALKNQGVCVELFESSIDFSEFTVNADGLVPTIVQDYQTKEVLMLAYMNAESYQKTCETGRMTYYSRSRKELWCKGDTSGHYQYVKSLALDCDKDTILAQVRQIGAACHTGSHTCFYTELAKKDYVDTNPLTVLTEDYDVIMDRKKHPKEGSYTNYLFDKGIDKILKKCGEEATEICIAAKNPDAEEVKYEIADYLYHLMVLMAECGIDWGDVMKELANRR